MQALDISHAEDAEHLTSKAQYSAVFHASGVLHDGMIGNQTLSAVRKVFAPKLGAAGRLQAGFSNLPLAQVVLFSSIASLIGAAGQSNYVAANGALDGWSTRRVLAGEVCTAVQWGAWASSGMASASVKARLERLGQGVLRAEAGLSALNSLLKSVACSPDLRNPALDVVAVNPFDWDAYLKQGTPELYSHMEQYMSTAGRQQAKGQPGTASTAAAASDTASGVTVDSIQKEVEGALVEVLGSALSPNEPLMSGQAPLHCLFSHCQQYKHSKSR